MPVLLLYFPIQLTTPSIFTLHRCLVLLVFEMSDPNSEFPKPLDDPKQDARLARLSVKKISEEKLRRELATIAHAKCSEYGKAFSECSQREGFKVVFTCRDECAACEYVFLPHLSPLIR